MIRPTTPAEADVLVQIAADTGVFKPIEIAGLREALHASDAERHSIAWEEKGLVLGFAVYAVVAMTGRTWELRWLAVHKDHQGRGVGTKLLRFVEEEIRATHGGRVLFIDTGSTAAYDLTRRFYAKHGYEQHATVQDFWADGDSLVVFRKRL